MKITTKIKFTETEYMLILSSIYTSVIILMNIFCMKPISFGLPFIVMDGGLLISWIAFAALNIITESYGELYARKLIIVTFVISLSFAIFSFLVTLLPTTEDYVYQAIHFKYIFSSNFRTIIASHIAMLLSSILHVKIIDKLSKYTSFVKRAFVSASIGQLIDNALFELIAFMPIGLSVYELKYIDILTAVLCSTIIEVTLQMCFTIPFGHKIIKKLKPKKKMASAQIS